MARPFRGKYLFVYPFVKTRAWYALDADERWRIMQGHIQVGREYPGVDNHTTYCFGLDDQEFVVAFDTDDIGTFLDLVQRLRTTEASAFTLRDTPSFTCIAASRRAGAQRARRRGADARLRHERRRGPRHHDHRRGPGRADHRVLGRDARGVLPGRRLAARHRRAAHHAVSGEVDLRRPRPPQDPRPRPRREPPRAGDRAVRRPGPPRDDRGVDLLRGRGRGPRRHAAHRHRARCARARSSSPAATARSSPSACRSPTSTWRPGRAGACTTSSPTRTRSATSAWSSSAAATAPSTG